MLRCGHSCFVVGHLLTSAKKVFLHFHFPQQQQHSKYHPFSFSLFSSSRSSSISSSSSSNNNNLNFQCWINIIMFVYFFETSLRLFNISLSFNEVSSIIIFLYYTIYINLIYNIQSVKEKMHESIDESMTDSFIFFTIKKIYLFINYNNKYSSYLSIFFFHSISLSLSLEH